MKKLLSVLASMTLVASNASVVLACSDNSSKKVQPVTPQAQKTADQSVNKIKSYILADQYGLDLKKTQELINAPTKGQDTNMKTEIPGFIDPNESVMQGMNLNGTLGRDNLPIYQAIDQLNDLLAKYLKDKAPHIDADVFLQNWGKLIKEVPQLLNSSNLSTALSFIPTAINVIQKLQLIPAVDMGPRTADGIGELARLIGQIVGDFDLNSMIAKLVGTDGMTVAEIQQKGVDALDDLLNNIIFKDASKLDDPKVDSQVSAWVGKNVLTPLLNQPKPTGDKAKDDAAKQAHDKAMMDNIKSFFDWKKWKGFVVEIADDLMTFIASIGVSMTIYYPMEVDEPKDANHLFGYDDNQTIFNKNDSRKIAATSVENSDLKIDGQDAPFNVSLNDIVSGTLDLISNTDEKSFDILKLTNVLFHSNNGNVSPLLSKLANWVVDTLKYTDYEVKLSSDGQPISLGDPTSLGLAKIKAEMYLDEVGFNLKDLFKSGSKINIGSIKTSYQTKKIIGGWSDWSSPEEHGRISIDINGNGLLDLTNQAIVPLLSGVLTGNDGSLQDLFNKLIDSLRSSDKNPVYLDISLIAFTIPLVNIEVKLDFLINPIIDALKSTIWTKVSPLLTNLLIDLFYKNDQPNSLSKLTNNPDAKPLSQTIYGALSTPINGLPIPLSILELKDFINLDAIVKMLKDIFMENEVQEEGKTGQSLVEQILPTLIPEDKDGNQNPLFGHFENWASDLGFVPNDQASDKHAKYIKVDSIMGQIYSYVYKEIFAKDFKPSNPGLFSDDKKLLNIQLVTMEQSKVATALNNVLNNLGDKLQGKDISGIVNPLGKEDNKGVWTTENIVDSYFTGTNDIQYESYDLVFNSSSVSIDDTTIHKGRYRVYFKRSSNKVAFEFKKIEKIS